MDQNGKCIDKCDNYPECKPCGDLISFKLCECGSNERAALDCTMKTCRHPKYIENLKAEALANQKEEEDKRIKENNLERESVINY